MSAFEAQVIVRDHLPLSAAEYIGNLFSFSNVLVLILVFLVGKRNFSYRYFLYRITTLKSCNFFVEYFLS